MTNELSIIEASGRARCPYCDNIIDKEEKQITGNLGSGNYGYNYHIHCFISRNAPFINELNRLIGASDELQDILTPM